MNKRVVVIGGGASGLFAAGVAVECGADVTVIERNDKPARKVLLTGKGRCNVTNDCNDLNTLISNVPTNGRFLFSAFSKFMPSDTIRFFEEHGVPLKTERGNRVFPVSDKASDIAAALIDYALEGSKMIHARVKKFVIKESLIDSVVLENGEQIPGDCFILATGGASYKNTGSTGDGYHLARSVGHTVTDIRPSLVALEAEGELCRELQGLSLKNTALTLSVGNKVIYKDFGEMLFTHFGVSGPMVLRASAHLDKKTVRGAVITLDLKPALSEKQLDERILRDFSKSPNKNISNEVISLMPHKLIEPLLKVAGIDMYAKVNTVTKQQRQELIGALKGLKITISDFYDINSAIITSGGINVKEIEPKTMRSRICDNLYFAGEVIDVDAYTGGFNLQIAFSTAYSAATNAAKS